MIQRKFNLLKKKKRRKNKRKKERHKKGKKRERMRLDKKDILVKERNYHHNRFHIHDSYTVMKSTVRKQGKVYLHELDKLNKSVNILNVSVKTYKI